MRMEDHKNLGENKLDIKPSASICRCLLPTEYKQALTENCGVDVAEKSKLWNFDFIKNVPIHGEDGLQWKVCPEEYYVKSHARRLATSEEHGVITMGKELTTITPTIPNDDILKKVK